MDFLIGFREAARKQSIAKASEALHISHTALSKQIKSLEQRFDVQLFMRTAQGVKLTDAGQILYERSGDLLDQMAAITSSLEPYKEWRHVRIGTMPDIASQYLLPYLQKLEKQGHIVELVCRQSTREVYRMLFDGEVELLVAERASMHPSVWMGDLHHEPLIAVMTVDHPFAVQSKITLSELGSQPLILYVDGCTIRAKLTSLFASMNLPMRIKTEVRFHEVILGYVEHSSEGITVLPQASVTRISDRLVTVPLDHPDARRTISVFSLSRSKGEKIWRLLS
ncbi:LysR family transcriptional regulator [Paenibacillus humicola]|uniref:LysR family transcriptional regulator n=1 Tax=Paenibacillus humicola TaxID=3110540 RepID=UPI00237BEC8C|nr:LysR family transcriptional regulator [Paenibacillus humicola]